MPDQDNPGAPGGADARSVGPPRSGASPGSPSTAPERLRGVRVLLVDDSPDAVEALRMLLTLEGAEVLTAPDAPGALDLLDGRPLDLVCSDIAMPGMDGYALVAAVRKLPPYEKLAAIALTGLGRNCDVERAHNAGFDAHLVKPFRFEQLLATLEQLGVTRAPGAASR